MPQAEGSQGQIIYDVETTFKTDPVTPDCKVLYFLSESGGVKRTLNKSNIIRGNRNPIKPTRGNLDVAKTINTQLSPYMGTILKHLIGTVATTGAGPYTHTGKIGALPVGLVFEHGFKDIGKYFKYNGCRINKGSFEFNSDGPIPFNFDYLGAKRTKGNTSLDVTPTDLGHDPFDGFEASILEGGSAIAYVQKVVFDVENQLDGGVYVIGGAGERRAIPAGSTLISGTLSALFESDTLLDKAINNTESSLKITLTKGDGLGSAGNESLELFITELLFEEKDPELKGPEGVLIELPFAAYYNNAAETTAFQFILKNTQSTI